MPRLPPLSGRELVRALKKLGFVEAGQRGSHLKLRREKIVCIVPLHDELRKGTLAGILRQADVTSVDLLEVLGQ